MADRLTRITTGTGDGGTTRLADGCEVAKHDPRTEALGSVDELNSLLGVVQALLPGHPDAHAVEPLLSRVQHRLFDLGAALAVPGHGFDPDSVECTVLTTEVERINAGLPALTEFLIPGGSPLAAQCQLARAVCRRAERRLTACAAAVPEAVPGTALVYLNRLSDLLFVLARQLNRGAGAAEPVWRPAPMPDGGA